MCVIDLEPCDVWRESKHKARKTKRCSCCRAWIEPGTVYWAHFSVYAGEASTGSLGPELGYISIAELIANGAELDIHWTPRTLGEALAGKAA